MGIVISGDVGQSGDVRTKADLNQCLAIVRAGSPRWCRGDNEFESVANEVIAGALRGFDPARSRFSDRLVTRASFRVARGLLRSRPMISRRAEIIDLTDVEEPVLITRGAVGNDPTLVVDDAVNARAFIETLRGSIPRAVATLLAAGLTQAEISSTLRLHPRRVSRIVASLRPAAEQFFGPRRPLATTA